ncbi:MAG: toll/interleukin-1 receptor domain-containing protein [Aquirhabdus sp.]
MAPKIFVSHASEDKERFVIPFSTALRQRGIDAWVDRWEMLPGDSLVDKIFEEGLKEAAAVIIVISDVSVTKPWVREELNAAVVARINKGTKLIPIVLENCDVPEALHSTVWEPVADPSNFGACLNRVVDAVFDHTSKPPIGNPPAYVSVPALPAIKGLTAADTLVLIALYNSFLAHGGSYVSPEEIVTAMQAQGMDMSIASESLEVLAHEGYAELLKHLGPGPYHSRILSRGVSMMLGTKEADLVRRVGLCVVNNNLEDSDSIASAIGEPNALVDHAINRLEGQGHLKAIRSIGGTTHIYLSGPTLRRILATTM